MPDRTHVACLNLAPWPLTLLEKQHRGVPAAVLNEGRRVLHVSGLAQDAGVQVGMRETAALSRCPELHAEVISGPTAQAAWNELLEMLYARYSDRVEGRELGVAYLKITEAAGRELAAALHATVGLAASREVALLAALRAKAGELKLVLVEGDRASEKLFLQLTPLAHLTALGLTAAHIQRLHFLGMKTLADLWKWSAAQREAFLGVDAAKRLNRFLKGERAAAVPRYSAGQIIEGRLAFDQPLHEPGEAEAALADLLPPLWLALRGRTAAYLTLTADTLGGTLQSTRKLKGPLDEAGLGRIAGLALEDTGALALGVDVLSVQLSGLQQPARMVGLWAGVAELEVTKQVLDRFPEALVRVQWLDPYAYTADAQYQWVDWLSGEVRPTRMTPTRPAPLTQLKSHDLAVNKLLAFFEGHSP